MTDQATRLLGELRGLRLQFDEAASAPSSEAERQFCLDVDRDQPIARERPVTSFFHRFARDMASWWGWGRMRISLASRSWLNSRKLGVPSTSHNSQRHSSTTQRMSSACVDDSGIRGCSGTVSPPRWFGPISLSGAWVSRPTAPDTPRTGTRARRSLANDLRPVLIRRPGTTCSATSPGRVDRYACGTGGPTAVAGRLRRTRRRFIGSRATERQTRDRSTGGSRYRSNRLVPETHSRPVGDPQ